LNWPQYILRDSRTNILVVEESKNVAKILEIRNELPDLKKIVQYSGTPVTHPGTNVVKQLDSIELYKMNLR
jgi:long-chain-fatty-acid--CoA ligase ACSBG